MSHTVISLMAAAGREFFLRDDRGGLGGGGMPLLLYSRGAGFLKNCPRRTRLGPSLGGKGVSTDRGDSSRSSTTLADLLTPSSARSRRSFSSIFISSLDNIPAWTPFSYKFYYGCDGEVVTFVDKSWVTGLC